MQTLLQDVRYGWRMLAKAPGLAAVVVITLALGIAANALVFSIINGFLLRPLPVPHPEQIAVLAASQKADLTLGYSLSYPEYTDFRKQTAPFAELFGYTLGVRGLSADNRADQVLGCFVTGNYFSTLGVRPALGRLISSDEEDQPGQQPVVVLGYSYWQQRFGASLGVIGKQVRVNGHSASIVGVLPREFQGTQILTDPGIYLPLNARMVADSASVLEDRSARFINVLGRLKPDVSFSQAQTSADVIATRLAKQYPATDGTVTVRIYREWLARPFPVRNNVVPALAIFFLALAALLLLLACMNVTNVLLARSTARMREMVLRAALGAGRSRLLRQMLTETLFLGLIGGFLGVMLGLWANPGDLFRLANQPYRLDMSFDWHVFAYSLAASVFAGAFVGLWPALRASRADLSRSLGEGGRNETGGGRNRLRSALVIAQVAGSLMLLVVAGLFVRSLRHAETMYLGFDPNHLLNVTVDPNAIGFDQARSTEFYRQLKERIQALPGVQSVSEAYAVPMAGTNAAYAAAVHIEGQQLARDQNPPRLFFNNVDTPYFDTMRIPLLRGRAFTDLDNESATPVAIVTHYMAERFWPHQDAIGKRFTFQPPNGRPKTLEIVGVVADGKYIFIAEGPNPFFYVPLAQNFTAMRAVQVRTSVAPENLLQPVQKQIHALAPDLPIMDAKTMRQTLAGPTGLMFFRVGAQVASGLGGIGLILAVIGLYGIVSFTAAQRTREIGIRIALGGSARDILRLILGQGVRMLIAGLAVGLIAAFALAHFTTRVLVGVSPNDPFTYLVVALMLSAITLVACWIPARRATRVDPGITLRYE
ncbi:MAG TPA: ABC transporter permease [Bryobacteraceae bacterium]|nr:ABC transporter permease [Bryobacteraceae bacterium]